jgi:hypothetical protein
VSPSATLLDALKLLRHQAAEKASPFDLTADQSLMTAVVSEIDKRCLSVKQPKIRPDLVSKWNAASASNSFESISNTELRHLFWSKDVALSETFLRVVLARQMKLGRSSLRGMVYSLASAWTSITDGTLALEKYRSFIRNLSTTLFLDKVEPYVLDRAGHSKFAYDLLTSKKRLSEQFSEVFGITFAGNEYADEALTVLSEIGYRTAYCDSEKDRNWFYQEVLSSLDKQRLLKVLARIVSGIQETGHETSKEMLKQFILGHPNLGDPRLPGFDGNWDRDAEITRLVIEWLSQSDINFFFELFFENKSDTQGRKQFWLKYAHLVRGTRVIVSDMDKKRLYRQLTELTSKNKHSRLLASLIEFERATVFMMDFGKLKAVEFSLPGHACYFYSDDSKFKFNERNVFWSTDRFSIRDLKSKTHTKRIVHREGWERESSNYLASFGIRPKTSQRRY